MTVYIGYVYSTYWDDSEEPYFCGIGSTKAIAERLCKETAIDLFGEDGKNIEYLDCTKSLDIYYWIEPCKVETK